MKAILVITRRGKVRVFLDNSSKPPVSPGLCPLLFAHHSAIFTCTILKYTLLCSQNIHRLKHFSPILTIHTPRPHIFDMEPAQAQREYVQQNRAQPGTYYINSPEHMREFSLAHGLIALLWSMLSTWVFKSRLSDETTEINAMLEIGVRLFATSAAASILSAAAFFGVSLESWNRQHYGRMRWLLGEGCRTLQATAFFREMALFFLVMHWFYGEMYKDHLLEIVGFSSLLMFKDWYIRRSTVFGMLDYQLAALDEVRRRNELQDHGRQ
ncbi:hypothetical protein HYALB_00009400 [Hymenoscyphus albidus]|uniref:Uncharacterized protein n=1 Tax=Hymenoscyphus albidus TaxID=595503 RepID=A0A9N9LMI8_9HELO|nr:hypothetical protein HYALB_00009400 [Hymenoscyphus albidus]